MLSRARTGQGGGLLLRGEPGIGKSALLKYARERASGGCVLAAAGTAAESDLAYAAVHRGLARHSVPDLVEAAVRAGRPELGAERLPGYLAWADAVGSAEAGALAARSRALLAGLGDPGEADVLFEESLRLHAATDQPMQQARTTLLYGDRPQARRGAGHRPAHAAGAAGGPGGEPGPDQP